MLLGARPIMVAHLVQTITGIGGRYPSTRILSTLNSVEEHLGFGQTAIFNLLIALLSEVSV
jgi:hypothetical protein